MLLEGHPCGVLILSTVQISVTVLDSFVTKFLQKNKEIQSSATFIGILGRTFPTF